jgi:hypothetical protein
MQVQPVKFTASGVVGTAAHTATDAQSGATISVAEQPEMIVGIAYKGFTAVIVHNGVDATGDVVAVCGAAGTYSWNYELDCQLGIYLECTGSGSGSVWLV